MDTDSRFWQKVNRPDGDGGCWLWTAYLDPFGYGRFNTADEQRAHRWSYKRFVGPIPPGLVIDHLCRVRHCVNPAHLRVVTSRANTHAAGSEAPAKRLREATTCIRGHPWDVDNTAWTRKGYRYCLACHRKRAVERRARDRTAVCPAGHVKVPAANGCLYCPRCHSESRRKPPRPTPTTFTCSHERSATGQRDRNGVLYCAVCRVEKRRR